MSNPHRPEDEPSITEIIEILEAFMDECLPESTDIPHRNQIAFAAIVGYDGAQAAISHLRNIEKQESASESKRIAPLWAKHFQPD